MPDPLAGVKKEDMFMVVSALFSYSTVQEEEEEADEEVAHIYNERKEIQRKLVTGITM